MTDAERRERATKLCRRLSEDVAKRVPTGIGAWDPAWEIVGQADVDFIVALDAWVAAPSEERRLVVRDAYNGVLAAWDEATRRYQRERAER